MSLLTEGEIRDLVKDYGFKVNEGRTIDEIIEHEDIPELDYSIVRFKKGKVSDSVLGLKLPNGTPIRLMYRSNRISTHDKSRGSIPFKDQVLAVNHEFMRGLVKEILGTSQIEIEGLKPTSTVVVAENLRMLPFENIVRKYMAVTDTKTSLYHAWKQMTDGEERTNTLDMNGPHLREIYNYCGYNLTDMDLSPNCELPYLMFTPTSKGEVDFPLLPSELSKLLKMHPNKIKNTIINPSFEAFNKVNEYVRKMGIVLVDTKTEHGINLEGKIVSADELYTLDSSRFWRLNDDGTLERDGGGNPKSYSKEFARGMVKDSITGTFTKEQRIEIAVRYIQAIQMITGKAFEPDLRTRDERIIDSTNQILRYVGIKKD